MIRSDCTAFGMVSNNMSNVTPIGAEVMISYMDFNQVPTLNTFVSWKNLKNRPFCYLGPAYYIPPFNANFLR
jgi:hypothetical protein